MNSKFFCITSITHITIRIAEKPYVLLQREIVPLVFLEILECASVVLFRCLCGFMQFLQCNVASVLKMITKVISIHQCILRTRILCFAYSRFMGQIKGGKAQTVLWSFTIHINKSGATHLFHSLVYTKLFQY